MEIRTDSSRHGGATHVLPQMATEAWYNCVECNKNFNKRVQERTVIKITANNVKWLPVLYGMKDDSRT